MHAIGELSINYSFIIVQFSFPVYHKGDFDTVFGCILYDEDELRIDNPFTRSRLITRWSEYNEVDGNLQEFVLEKCRGMLRDKWSDANA